MALNNAYSFLATDSLGQFMLGYVPGISTGPGMLSQYPIQTTLLLQPTAQATQYVLQPTIAVVPQTDASQYLLQPTILLQPTTNTTQYVIEVATIYKYVRRENKTWNSPRS